MSTTALLEERVAQDPAGRLIAIPDSFGGWFDLTAQEFLDRVRGLAKGLLSAGLHTGDRIGVLCSNRFEATLVDFAAGMIGVATVPVRREAGQSEILAVLDDSGVSAMIVESAGDFARFDELHGDLPGVLHVWQIGLSDLDKLADAGRDVSDADLDARAAGVQASTMAGLLYSVGSDGEPMHVVVTHGSVTARARDLAAALGDAVGVERSIVQILPAVDVNARLIVLVAVLTGTRLGHLHERDDLIEILRSFRPTLLVGVPETFAAIDEAGTARSEASGRGTAFRQAHDVALEYATALGRGPVPMGVRTRFAVADTLVLRGLRKSVGGQVSHIVSIAESTTLPDRLRLLMRALDVRPVEGYGVASTGGLAVIERQGDPFELPLGTVGSPLPGIEVAIERDDEVSLRGPGISADTADGWLRTGLFGQLDDGRLTLFDRDLTRCPPGSPPPTSDRPPHPYLFGSSSPSRR